MGAFQEMRFKLARIVRDGISGEFLKTVTEF